MSGVFGNLFGEQPQQVTQPTAFQTLPVEVQRTIEAAQTRGLELGGRPELFAPAALQPQQLQAIEQLGGLAQPLTQEQFQTGVGTFFNPFQEQVLQNTIADIQRGGRGFISDIGAGASAAGGFGGTRQAVLESELGRNLLETIGRESGVSRAQAFESAAGRALGEIGRQRQGALDLLGAGGLLQQQALGQQQAPLRAVEFLSQLGTQVPGGGGGIGFGPEQPGALGRVSKVAAQFGQAAAPFLGVSPSDRRLKNNIKLIDNKNGFNIYEFSYNGMDGVFEGVMADEVEGVMPEAVVELSGYKAVNYDKIGIEFKRVA